MPPPRRSPPRYAQLETVPFLSAEEAWIWGMQGLLARQDGARPVAGMALYPRPCEPDDLVLVLQRLHRRGRVSSGHIRVMIDFGRQLTPPDERCREEELAARLWEEALDQMLKPLKAKGIVQ